MAPPDGLEPPTLKVETSCSDPTELRGQSLKNFYFINDAISYLFKDRVVPLAGLEPARPKARNFKFPMSTVPSQGHTGGYYNPPPRACITYRSGVEALAATAHLHRYHLGEEC
jgi:hypothetical protein